MKILLVDDEEQVVKGVTRLISCEEDEWEVDSALSGEAALDVLSQEKFDVVVSDMRMPGMDGAQLLETISKKYPSMLRVILSGQADRESVLRAVKPMHQFLSKPCDPEELFEVISRGRIFQETIQSAEVLDAIGRANNLPSFPEIVNEINCEISSESGSTRSIAAIVSKDPVLSARLLHLANSAIFCSRYPIANIDRAISLVGNDMIRSLAMSQAVYAKTERKDQVLSAQQLLNHGSEVAETGKRLAMHVGASADDANIVFAAGLLHDVGKLILLNTFPDKYKLVFNEASKNDKSLEQLEMETFGATHQGIGGYLFGLWGLPAEVTAAVASHHSLQACANADGLPCKLVFAANWIVNNQCPEKLQQLADEIDDDGEAERFVSQIIGWQEHLSNTESGE